MAKPEEIYLLGKSVRLLQPVGGFRSCLDSVLVAAACPAHGGQSVLDLGCGVGGASLCLLKRVPGVRLTGIDIQEDHIVLAEENAALNGMAGEFLHADITNFLRADSFDHVICNPPYLEAGAHLPSPSAAKAVAHGHTDENTNLQDWITCAHRNLKNGGMLTMIHRADQTDTILKGLGKHFGGVEIIPLWPKAGTPAKRVIIRALKNRKTPATLHPGLILHEGNGDYTAAADDILRSGKALY